MRAIVIPSIVICLGLIGCANHHPTEVATSAQADQLPAPSAQYNVPLPLKGNCETVMAAPAFVSPGMIRQVDSGTCQLSHLGRVTFYSDKVINTIAGTQVTEASFTAANGDSIYVTGSGTNTPLGNGLVAFSTNLELVGGTGRFERVTGEASVTGEANVIARESTLTLEGSITYTAADRKAK